MRMQNGNCTVDLVEMILKSLIIFFRFAYIFSVGMNFLAI